MELYINGEQIEAQIENETTIGDVLTSFAKECDDNKAAVIGIIVDGIQVTAETFDERAKEELKADTKFEFDVVTESAIHESFVKLTELFESLAKEMEEIPVKFMSGQGRDANLSIKNLADSIDQFCHMASLASLFPDTFTNTKIGDKNFNEFFADFSPVLSDFESALQNDDTVLIGDLCEYEICPRLMEIATALKNM